MMLIPLVFMVICGSIAGQFHHIFGIAPVLGAVLCASCFLRPKDVIVIGLGGILVHDLWSGLSGFTWVRLTGMAFVISTILILKVRPTVRSLLVGLLVSSPVFHLVLASGDWLTGTCGLFPLTTQGLLSSLGSSFPYFQRALIGDLLFTSLFLTAYTVCAYLLSWWPHPELRKI